MSMRIVPPPFAAARLGAGLLFLVAAVGLWRMDLPAQETDPKAAKTDDKKNGGKRKEVEDDQPPPVKRSIPVPEEEGKARPPRRPAATGNLRLALDKAKHPETRRLFQGLLQEHDEIVYKNNDPTGPNKIMRIEPIAQYVPKPAEWKGKELEVRELKDGEKEGNRYVFAKSALIEVRPYEKIIQERVTRFLGQHLEDNAREPLSRLDQLLAAEEALSAAVRFHQSARQSGRRAGTEWDAVQVSLQRQLLDVLSEQLKILSQANEWDDAFDLAQRLSDSYPENQADVAAPLAELLLGATNSALASEERMQEVRKRLQRLEQQFPDSDAVRKVTEGLRAKAKELFDMAQAATRKPEPRIEEAKRLVKKAMDTWPGLPGLREFKIKLDNLNPVLKVGVRDLPKMLSPSLAATDADRRGVEMIFESLVKFSPESAGVGHYHPALAEGRPLPVPLGRRFRLPANAYWSNGTLLTNVDVRHSVRQVKEGHLPGWGDLLDKMEVRAGDPNSVKLTLRQGLLEPLAPMAFKVIPSGANPESATFAKAPVGSGPFEYKGLQSDGGRECAAFVANPNYGTRENRTNLPRLQEIRFFVYQGATGADVAKELQNRAIDLALDLTAAQFAELKKAPPEGVKLLGPLPNRRVWFLAVNHRRQNLQNADFRLALARAINREKILDKHFRAPEAGEAHAALNGPFPAGSWACNPKLKPRADKPSLDPYDPIKSRTFWEKATAAGVPGKMTLSLKYPREEPGVAAALEDLRDQLKAEFPDLTLELVPCDARTLHQDVEVTHSYDLAYYHYDFPDDSFSLWPLLGPGPGGRPNYLGYVPGGEVQAVMQECLSRRDFTEVRKYVHLLHDFLLSKEMPLIPLWGLDSFVAVRDQVEHPPFDPLLVFTDAEQWKLR
jgi:ABC-type transport system substrate-binding protein